MSDLIDLNASTVEVKDVTCINISTKPLIPSPTNQLNFINLVEDSCNNPFDVELKKVDDFYCKHQDPFEIVHLENKTIASKGVGNRQQNETKVKQLIKIDFAEENPTDVLNKSQKSDALNESILNESDMNDNFPGLSTYDEYFLKRLADQKTNTNKCLTNNLPRRCFSTENLSSKLDLDLKYENFASPKSDSPKEFHCEDRKSLNFYSKYSSFDSLVFDNFVEPKKDNLNVSFDSCVKSNEKVLQQKLISEDENFEAELKKSIVIFTDKPKLQTENETMSLLKKLEVVVKENYDPNVIELLKKLEKSLGPSHSNKLESIEDEKIDMGNKIDNIELESNKALENDKLNTSESTKDTKLDNNNSLIIKKLSMDFEATLTKLLSNHDEEPTVLLDKLKKLSELSDDKLKTTNKKKRKSLSLSPEKLNNSIKMNNPGKLFGSPSFKKRSEPKLRTSNVLNTSKNNNNTKMNSSLNNDKILNHVTKNLSKRLNPPVQNLKLKSSILAFDKNKIKEKKTVEKKEPLKAIIPLSDMQRVLKKQSPVKHLRSPKLKNVLTPSNIQKKSIFSSTPEDDFKLKQMKLNNKSLEYSPITSSPTSSYIGRIKTPSRKTFLSPSKSRAHISKFKDRLSMKENILN